MLACGESNELGTSTTVAGGRTVFLAETTPCDDVLGACAPSLAIDGQEYEILCQEPSGEIDAVYALFRDQEVRTIRAVPPGQELALRSTSTDRCGDWMRLDPYEQE